MTAIRLCGCRPQPLASYLKALAVLRLVAEQRTPNARGFWRGDAFNLECELDEDALLSFFRDEYRPTPIVAPWNSGSGFSEGSKVEATKALEAIRVSEDVRLADVREAIDEILTWPELPPAGVPIHALLNRLEKAAEERSGRQRQEVLDLCKSVRDLADSEMLDLRVAQLKEAGASSKLIREAGKLRTAANKVVRAAGKEEIIRACRARLSDRAVEWLDATVALGADRERRLPPPPLLGSGGNEGNLDYGSNFMQRIADLLVDRDPASSEALLRNALFGAPADGLTEASVGQHDPGRAGGSNQGPGIEREKVPANPWNFVLTMEGAVVWASSIARRQSASGLSSPFTVRSRPVGYPSSSPADAKATRAEIWMPLWSNPVAYGELKTFLSEGRAEVGRRPARDAVEFAEAAVSLGVDRGIDEFVRYSLLKRRGDSYVALPAGRFEVRTRSEADLVRQLDPILATVDAFLRSFLKQQPPPRLAAARRVIDERILDLLQRGSAGRMKELLAAAGRFEKLIAERDREKKPRLNRPLSGLGADWLVATDDGSIEVRLAAALASIGPTGKVGPLRANLSSVSPTKPYLWATTGAETAWRGKDLPARLAAVLARRMMDAERLDCPRNPLSGAIRVSIDDVMALLNGDLDEELLEDLLFGFTLVRWHDHDAISGASRRLWERRSSQPKHHGRVSRAFCLLKLLFLPAPLRAGDAKIHIRPEPAVVPLLLAGRIDEACRIAQRRLFASGLVPVRATFPRESDGVRLAAALLLPVRGHQSLARRVLMGEESERR